MRKFLKFLLSAVLNPSLWIVAGLLVCLFIGLNFQTRQRVYVPKSGHLATVYPTPPALLDPQGMIRTDLLETAIRVVVQKLAAIDPQETLPFTHWQDGRFSTNSYSGWGGEYTTMPAPLPIGILQRAPKMKFGLLTNDEPVLVVVRYWTGKEGNEAGPQRLYLSVDLKRQNKRRLNESTLSTAIADFLSEELRKDLPL
jgi:hypothetical protein